MTSYGPVTSSAVVHARDARDRLGDGGRLADLGLDEDVRLDHLLHLVAWGSGTRRRVRGDATVPGGRVRQSAPRAARAVHDRGEGEDGVRRRTGRPGGCATSTRTGCSRRSCPVRCRGRPDPAMLRRPGDDAAVVAARGGSVVATTDTMVRGRDWRDDWSGAGDVGGKVVAQNLADVAAMGAARPALLVTLVADPPTAVDWVARDFADGAGPRLADGRRRRRRRGPVVRRAVTLVVSVTALGDLAGPAPPCSLRARARATSWRSPARLGRSGAGLDLLRAGRPEADPEAGGRATCARSRRWPPGPPPRSPGRTRCSTSATGCCATAAGSAAASGVRLDLDSAALPRAATWPGWPRRWGSRGRPALRCVAGGEEHSLLATFPPDATLPEGVPRHRDRLRGAAAGAAADDPGPGLRGHRRRSTGARSRLGPLPPLTRHDERPAPGEGCRPSRSCGARRAVRGEQGQRVTLPAFRQEVQTLSRLGVRSRPSRGRAGCWGSSAAWCGGGSARCCDRSPAPCRRRRSWQPQWISWSVRVVDGVVGRCARRRSRADRGPRSQDRPGQPLKRSRPAATGQNARSRTLRTGLPRPVGCHRWAPDDDRGPAPSAGSPRPRRRGGAPLGGAARAAFARPAQRARRAQRLPRARRRHRHQPLPHHRRRRRAGRRARP